MPIVDAHLHLWDLSRLSYPWLTGDLARDYLPADLAEADALSPARVFVEAGCLPEQALAEVDWVSGLAPALNIEAIVAFAPVEQGERVAPHLARLAQNPLVRGVRRILQGSAPGFSLTPGMREGLGLLAAAGLSFDACVSHEQLPETIEMVDAVPELSIVLDHLGKPVIGSSAEPVAPSAEWAEAMARLAERPSVSVKLSGLAAEATGGWDAAQCTPFLDVAGEAFGPERLLFGGDWPVSRPLERWRETVSEWARDRFGAEGEAAVMGGNARRVYRLGRP